MNLFSAKKMDLEMNQSFNSSMSNITLNLISNWKSERDDVLDLGEHWRSFGPPPPGMHIFIGVLMIIVGSIGVTSNIIVIFAFCGFRTLRRPSSILIVNLAVCDLCVSGLCFPIHAYSAIVGQWSFGRTGCNWYVVVSGVSGLASIATMASISIERYTVLILQTFRNPSIITGRLGFVAIPIVWTYAIVLLIPPLFGWGNFILEGWGYSCTFDYISQDAQNKGYVLTLFVCGFCVPVFIIVFCYSSIMRYVFFQKRELESMNAFRHSHLNKKFSEGSKTRSMIARRYEWQVTKTMVLTVVCFSIAWLPYAILALYGIFGNYKNITPLIATFPSVFAKFSTILNPIIYSLTNTRFRQLLRKRLEKTCSVLTKKREFQNMTSRVGFSTAHSSRDEVESGHVGSSDEFMPRSSQTNHVSPKTTHQSRTPLKMELGHKLNINSPIPMQELRDFYC
ncbi:unnamed protein product [Owenia fusiformis]|uniref:Uncharacterized protein n=1 Tax=Owenia fusiformis TaxID=6347 RepID=A0A8J1XXL9_OWEFU|nr:unnamed protein product [Owenia fusiformis]